MGVKAINFRVGIARKYFDTEARKFQRSVKRTFRSIGRLAGNLGVQLGAGFLVREIGRMTLAFETSMTKIETLVGLSSKQVAGFREEVLKLSTEARKSPQELSEALFTVTSAGIRGAEAMQVLERSAQASRIGLGETKEIARTTTAVLQAYGVENITAARATDVLVGIVREGNLEASELAPVLGRVIGLASTLGISFEEVGASIATFTRLGVDSAEAVTGLRGIMNALIQPSEQGKKALASVGMTFADLRNEVEQKGLADTLIKLLKTFEGNDEILSDIIPNVRALSAILGTAGVQADSYREILDNISNSTGVLDAGMKRVAQTAEDKLNKNLVELNKTAIELGNSSLPYVINLLDKLNTVATSDEGFWSMKGFGESFDVVGALMGIGIEADRAADGLNNFQLPLPGIAKDSKEAAKGLALLSYGMSGGNSGSGGGSLGNSVKEVETLADRIKSLRDELERQSEEGEINNDTLDEFVKLSDKAAVAQNNLEKAIKNATTAFGGYEFTKLPMIGSGIQQMPEAEDDTFDPDTTKVKTFREEMDDLHNSLMNIRDAYSSINSALSQYMANSQIKTENEINGIQKEIDAINQKYDAEQEKVTESIQNSRVRGEALKGVEEERKNAIAQKEQEITDIRNKELRKQAIANKITSIAESIINTALGVTKALSTGNPILAGIIGGMGAAQTSLIAAQQIPSFYTGGSFGGGMALVGERGPEMIKTSGASRVYNNRQTSSMLSGGRTLMAEVNGSQFLIWLDEQNRKRGNR